MKTHGRTANVSWTICKLDVIPIYLGKLPACGNMVFESWLNNANASIPTNGSINANTFEGALCVAPGYSSVRGGFGNGPYAWAIHCLDSWRIKGQCAFAVFTVLFLLHNKLAASYRSTSLNLHDHLKWELPGGIHNSRFASTETAFLPSE